MFKPAAIGESSEARPLGSLTLVDGSGLAYACAVHAMRTMPEAREAVYAYVRLEGTHPVALYVGYAEVLATGLAMCPFRAQAAALGAGYLLVHVPDPDDLVPAAEAALRLRRSLRPLLNAQPARGAAITHGTGLQQVAGG
ncbi:MAG: hypothetical protein AAGC57_03225 [Pseudomonadota bacterium]